MSRTVFWALSWVPVALTFTETVGQVMWVNGRSMQPALNPNENLGSNDLVVLQKWGLRSPQSIRTGDVVAFLSPLNPNRILIKRVLAKEGDTITPRPTSSYPKNEVEIPTNHLWVEGDNIHSIDSNDFGPISSGLVLGKATTILYPFNRFGPIPPGGRIGLGKSVHSND